MDDKPSLPNMIVNYSIILTGMVLAIFLISASFYMIVRRERILEKRFPDSERKVDAWGYPLEQSPPPGDDAGEKKS